MSLLEIDNLRIAFSTRQSPLVAVDDISLAIDPGEVLGMVGESGAGKSLTAMAILGLLDPPARIVGGQIRIEGKRIDSLPERQLRRFRGKVIGAVFQDPLSSLDPLYTIARQMVETIRTHTDLSAAAAREQAIALLADVGMPAPRQRIDAYPHQLSGGMRQRVVIALALCSHPRLIIADEPTSALDVSIQAQIIAVLRRLCHDRGTAILLISHDMGVIAEIADRVAVLYAGRIVEIGPVRDVLKRPKHPYTQGLMRSIPRIHEPSARLAQIEGAMPRLGEIPHGCPFHPRCPHVFERCRHERPELLAAGEMTGKTQAACWLFASHG
jgi:peptide/nickel transport system ATP-binding protein